MALRHARDRADIATRYLSVRLKSRTNWMPEALNFNLLRRTTDGGRLRSLHDIFPGPHNGTSLDVSRHVCRDHTEPKLIATENSKPNAPNALPALAFVQDTLRSLHVPYIEGHQAIRRTKEKTLWRDSKAKLR